MQQPWGRVGQGCHVECAAWCPLVPIMPTPDLDQLPTNPGVYVFKDSAGTVLYVGKAANLRARVKQYYAGTDERPTVRFLMGRAAGVETTVVDAVAEALLL